MKWYAKTLHALLMGAVMLGVTLNCSSTSSKKNDAPAAPAENAAPTPEKKAADGGIPAGAKALMKAYPDFVKGYRDNKLLMADGTTLVYDDGKEKTFEQRLNNADPEDMFTIPYDVNNWAPGYLHDPGRIRCEALYKKMYGASAAAVQRTLVPVKWFGQTVRFTKVNGAADALRKVAAELAKHPELKKYLKSSGSFYWRQVRFANRLSAHSFGMTIDIGVNYSDYWGFKTRNHSETTKGIKYCNRFPRTLVEIFEKHGFVWGGRWYHYDTMHFEYRPEYFVK
ncbi:MAG: M15 family metallopeptidase [Sodaliphilus sp.]